MPEEHTKTVRVAVMGAGGRMGRAIIRCAGLQAPPLPIVGAIDVEDCAVYGKDAGLVAGAGELGVAISSDLEAPLEAADVLIDFSYAQSTAAIAPVVAASGKAWIIGTTGLDEAQRGVVESASRTIPVVMAPNMSLGVNLLFTLVEQAARALKGKGYDIEIIERHHRRKKDSPSGTALGLGQAAARGMDWTLEDVARHGREGLQDHDRAAEEIGFHAVRGGDFVGDHTVLFAAEGESVELSHRATNRDTFAIGALRAAMWAAGRQPGLYAMNHVLGL